MGDRVVSNCWLLKDPELACTASLTLRQWVYFLRAQFCALGKSLVVSFLEYLGFLDARLARRDVASLFGRVQLLVLRGHLLCLATHRLSQVAAGNLIG